jgi:uncharacterized membrane protein
MFRRIEPFIGVAAIIQCRKPVAFQHFEFQVIRRNPAKVADAMIFVSLGAWPVMGFFGLDVLLVYFAFRANYRAARAYEEVTVTASELTVRKIGHRGGVRQWTLNPLWVRLERIVHEEFGIERLFLVSHGRRLAIGGFLSPAEKASFARALSSALGEAKRGPTRTTSV